MIIVSGWLRVSAAERQQYLDECRAVVAAARQAAGCLDFYLSADPVEDDRINVFERWETASAVEDFRESGPAGEQQAAILEAQVDQHEIASTASLT